MGALVAISPFRKDTVALHKEALSQVAKPVAIVVGTDDPNLNSASYDLSALESLPKALQVVKIPKAKTAPHSDNPEEFNKVLFNFLEALDIDNE